MPNVTKI